MCAYAGMTQHHVARSTLTTGDLVSAAGGADRLNILHVMRAPVGGLFRHVVDLVRGQAASGHRIGLVADASTGGARAEAALADLAPALALGLTRVAMSRQLGLQDVAACRHVTRRAAEIAAHVVHGHGAKGGAYARLADTSRAIRVYTPHGGSLHYDWRSPAGFVYLASERLLMRRTDLFLFESAYGREVFRRKVGDPGARARIVHNGVAGSEFAPVVAAADATDLVFIGELRLLKGVDVLIAAVARLAAEGRSVSVTIVGDGPDRARFEAAARSHDIRFVGAMPARAGFALGPRPGRSVAGGVAALHRARGGGRRGSDHRHPRRRHSRDLRTRCRPADPARRFRGVGERHPRRARRPAASLRHDRAAPVAGTLRLLGREHDAGRARRLPRRAGTTRLTKRQRAGDPKPFLKLFR